MATTSSNIAGTPRPFLVGPYITIVDLVAGKKKKKKKRGLVSMEDLQEKTWKVGPDRWKTDPPNKEGVWRSVQGNAVFFPKDGSEPVGLPDKVKGPGKKSGGVSSSSKKGKGTKGSKGIKKAHKASQDVSAADVKARSEKAKKLAQELKLLLLRVKSSKIKGVAAALKTMIRGLERGNARVFKRGLEQLSRAISKAS
jgi:hypothetical protein